jgi:hypothetical protein
MAFPLGEVPKVEICGGTLAGESFTVWPCEKHAPENLTFYSIDLAIVPFNCPEVRRVDRRKYCPLSAHRAVPLRWPVRHRVECVVIPPRTSAKNCFLSNPRTHDHRRSQKEVSAPHASGLLSHFS